MNVVGLDWNSTRALAVLGPAGDYPLAVPLDPPAAELAMLVSLNKAQPEVGRVGLQHCRTAPHLVCRCFLPLLGESTPTKTWQHGRRALDAAQAAQIVWQRLHAVCKGTHGVILALPNYLTPLQANVLRMQGEKARIPVLGSMPNALAAALAGHMQQLWSKTAVVIDVDDHALSLTLVKAVTDQAHLVELRYDSQVGLRAWKDRLIDAIADLCIWQTRRDPRDTPSAEQSLYEQLDGLFDACVQDRPLQLALQGDRWYQNLLLAPDQTRNVCAHLVQKIVQGTEELLQASAAGDGVPALLLTHQASRLPGLLPALRGLHERWNGPTETTVDRPRTSVEDFGENLLFESAEATAGVFVLAPDAPARAVHQLGEAFLRNELPRGHLDTSAPLPLTQSVEVGPARLHFQGHDYLLKDTSFMLGTLSGCNLVVDADLYPQVDERHCEVRFDRRTFLLFDRSQGGTLVNDAPVLGSVVLRAGDWIRLGDGGPMLRFLGRPRLRTSLVTTA